MEIKSTYPYSLPVNTTPIKADSTLWQAGQLLKAVVVNMENENIVLQVRQADLQLKLTTNTSAPLRLGQSLDLQITRAGSFPELKILTILENPRVTNTLENTKNIIHSALRQIIPKQTSLAPLLANLHYLSYPKPILNQQFPQQILDLSRSVFQRLPALTEIQTAQGLKQAIKSSGLFLEHQLSQIIQQETQLNEKDVRVSLLRLAQAIHSHTNTASVVKPPTIPTSSHQQTLEYSFTKEFLSRQNLTSLPQATSHSSVNKTLSNQTQVTQSAYHNEIQQTKSVLHTHPRVQASLVFIQNTSDAMEELFRQVENSLSRIQLNQLQQLIPDENGKMNWVFELPIRKEDGSDIFHFIIQRDSESQQSEKQRPWSISISFELQQLGSVRIQLSLIETNINVRIWAEQNNTYLLFQQHKQNLQNNLERSGLHVANMNCFCGIPLETLAITNEYILDEKV